MKSLFSVTVLIGYLVGLGAIVWLTAQDAKGSDASVDAKVDALFNPWNKPDSPGVVCAVMQDGKVIYAKGFGMAHLEHDIPLSPDSVFYIASTSKQFTAAAIALLVLDGKISLDADIRTFLPELRHLKSTVTVGQLVHHTSGFKDYFSLLALTGWRDTDYFDNDMVVKLLARQRTLNFEPGTEYSYSNSNYVLLAEIVKRVTGKPLREVAEERIFSPLGMTQTSFDDDYRRIVKNRVVSYLPGVNGDFHQLLKEFDGHGDGNLLTSVRDLARWDENFYTEAVGGKAFIELMHTKGVLNNGKEITYAFGLMLDTYRGLPTVRHSGGFKGFRTELLRFPQQHFSVAMLSNLGSVNAWSLANKVAEVFLAEHMAEAVERAAPVTDRPPTAIKIDSAVFDAYVGDYAVDGHPGFIVSFTRDGDRYFSQVKGQQKIEIFAESETKFFLTIADARYTFHREPDGSIQRATLHWQGDRHAVRIEPSAISAVELGQYSGTYCSEELDTRYRVDIEDGKLIVKHDRLPNLVLEPAERDTFRVDGVRIVFSRNDQGNISALLFSDFVVRDVAFKRDDVTL